MPAPSSAVLFGRIVCGNSLPCSVCQLAELSLVPTIAALRHRLGQARAQAEGQMRHEAEIVSALGNRRGGDPSRLSAVQPYGA